MALLFPLLVSISFAAAGCSTVLHAVHDPQPLEPRVWKPATRLNENARVDPETGKLLGTEGYGLYILTFAVGMDFTDTGTLLRTLHKHPNTDWKDNNVGHSWIILVGPERSIEGGHTGEEGMSADPYYDGVFELIRRKHPNPVSYLWHEFDDGRFCNDSNGHSPTFVVYLPITEEQYERIWEYIDTYDYKTFSLRGKQCTVFTSGAAALAGVNLASRLTIHIPSRIDFRGEDYVLWTDPQYRELTFGSPDVMEADLRQLVVEGIAEEAMESY